MRKSRDECYGQDFGGQLRGCVPNALPRQPLAYMLLKQRSPTESLSSRAQVARLGRQQIGLAITKPGLQADGGEVSLWEEQPEGSVQTVLLGHNLVELCSRGKQ